MALITTHATLKAAVAEWINRTDLSTSGVGIDLMIQAAERRLARDPRVRHLAADDFDITADDLDVPDGFEKMDSWYMDGPTYYHEIQIVPADVLQKIRSEGRLTGPPTHAAIIAGTFRFAPVPDATYATKMTWWESLSALSAGANWLVTSHPDIYLYATLCESAPYLMEDERLAVWEAELERRLEDLNVHTWDSQFSGSLRKQITPFGDL